MKQLPVARPDSSGRARPVKARSRTLRKTGLALPSVDVEPASSGSPFLSFRYSWTEVSTTGGNTRVRAKHARYEEGRLTTEQFEGELDRSVYERAMGDAQRRFIDQWSFFLRSLLA